MFHDILVPVDFTEKNLEALRLAQELALAGRGRITLLHVIERIEHLPVEGLGGFYEKLEKSAAEGMRSLTQGLGEHPLIGRQEIVYGKRAEEIVRFAEEHGSDLIVLSSHRVDPHRPGRWWSTVSHEVAVRAKCPVLLVK